MVKKVSAGIGAIIFLFCLGIYFFLRSDLPTYYGKKKLTGLSNEVSVNFDIYAIPHIYAKNAEDAYVALGYVHAQERLFQMEMIRRLASGKMAELLGHDLLDVDIFFRTLGIRNSAFKSAERLKAKKNSPELKYAQAYLNGINQFMDAGSTPLEFKMLHIPKVHFTLADIYTAIGYTAFGFSNVITQEPVVTRMFKKLGQPYMKDWNIDPKTTLQDSIFNSQLLALQPIFNKIKKEAMFPIKMGSNAWVVAPQKSISGKVILANDTHIFYSQPSTWFEAYIEYPGVSFYGNYIATIPFAFVGHNPAIAWGVTIFPTDNMDMYKEKANPENKDQVWVNDHWQTVEKQQQLIHIKDLPDTTISVFTTRHGQIINHLMKGKKEVSPISLRWVFNEMPSTVLEATYKLGLSTTIDEARSAVSLIDILGLNVLYGDSVGNIAWWAAGKISKRPAHVNSKLILDGASGKDELLGYYNFSENPQSENPSSGFLYSANHRPQAVKRHNFPGHYTPLARANRIKLLLESKEKFSIKDFKRMQADVVSDIDKKVAVYFAKNLKLLVNSDELEGVNELAAWDGNYDLESSAAVIYTKLQYYMLAFGFKDELGEEDFTAILNTYLVKRTINELFFNKSSLWWDDTSTPVKETFSDILHKAFQQTMSDLRKQLGSNSANWHWKDVHTLTHVHPIGKKKPFNRLFNVGPFAMPGTNEVINKMAFPLNKGGNYSVSFGPALRIIHDFSQPSNSISINPTGQSGHVMNKYYNDQAVMFTKNQYRKQITNRAELLENSIGTLILTPKAND